MNSITFVGTSGGDGECFCWKEVQRGDKIAIIGQENYDTDRSLEEDFIKYSAQEYKQQYDHLQVEREMEMLYPGDVMLSLGVEKGKKYKFTISAEEITDEVFEAYRKQNDQRGS
jgi:hypothetical protein